MTIGLMPAACCSGHDNAQTASVPPSAEWRIPVAVTSPVRSSRSVLISSSACRAYGSSSGTAAAKRRSLSGRDLAAVSAVAQVSEVAQERRRGRGTTGLRRRTHRFSFARLAMVARSTRRRIGAAAYRLRRLRTEHRRTRRQRNDLDESEPSLSKLERLEERMEE
jgi:nucleotidyltransferase/DNA polymerase involved in DNA repair